MELKLCKTPAAAPGMPGANSNATTLASVAHEWCLDRAGRHRARSFFVPAGNTPTPLYRIWERERPAFLHGSRLLQIDDVLTGSGRGMFARYFREQLPGYSDRFVAIESAQETADLCLLGFGVNGHVAFHEPGVPPGFFSGCLPLSEQSVSTLGLEARTWGVTYGLAAFLRSRAVLLMVSGEKKKAAFRRFLEMSGSDEDARELPAAGLKRHADLTVLVDFDWQVG